MKKFFVAAVCVTALLVALSASGNSTDVQNENSNSIMLASTSGTCYCNDCKVELQQRLEKEYGCVPCERCGRTGKLACRGENGKLDHWESCPDCTCIRDKENVANIKRNCGVNYGYIWQVVRQYYIYYCPRCGQKYSGC